MNPDRTDPTDPTDRSDQIDALLWLLLPLLILAFVPMGLVSNDGLGHSFGFAEGRWRINPNRLLFEPLGAWWQGLWSRIDPARAPVDALKLLSGLSGALAAGLFRWGVPRRLAYAAGPQSLEVPAPAGLRAIRPACGAGRLSEGPDLAAGGAVHSPGNQGTVETAWAVKCTLSPRHRSAALCMWIAGIRRNDDEKADETACAGEGDTEDADSTRAR